MAKKLKRWLFKPIIAIRPQSAPIGLIAIMIILLLRMNWPLSENTIELREVLIYLGVMVFGVAAMWLSEWYKDNRNQ